MVRGDGEQHGREFKKVSQVAGNLWNGRMQAETAGLSERTQFGRDMISLEDIVMI